MAAFPAPASDVVPADQLVLRAAVSAFLGRYRGQTRVHTESDLRVFLRWCTDQDLDPLAAARVDIERYVRWLQDICRYQPSTVSRRLSVVVGFYRVCVIDAILDHSLADYFRRPTVPAKSPTLGLGHLQFEALITTARLSTNPNDFALIALLGLLGLRIFEACGASIADLGEEHDHRVLRVRGKGGKVVLVPLPPAERIRRRRLLQERLPMLDLVHLDSRGREVRIIGDELVKCPSVGNVKDDHRPRVVGEWSGHAHHTCTMQSGEPLPVGCSCGQSFLFVRKRQLDDPHACTLRTCRA